MAVRVAAVSVLAALTVLILAGNGYAQQGQCCAERLDACHHDAFNDRTVCWTGCFLERQAALERCERDPSKLCVLIGPLYARCKQGCADELQRDFLLCLIRHKACLNERHCENPPTPTRTLTRTATPSVTRGIDPGPPDVGVATPTPTETPPR